MQAKNNTHTSKAFSQASGALCQGGSCRATPPARWAVATVEPPSPLFVRPSSHTHTEGLQTERCKEFSPENKLSKSLFAFLGCCCYFALYWLFGGFLSKANKANTEGFGRSGSKSEARWKSPPGDQQEHELGKIDPLWACGFLSSKGYSQQQLPWSWGSVSLHWTPRDLTWKIQNRR